MKKLNNIIWLIMLSTFSSVTSAALLNFNDFDNLGLNIGDELDGGMSWSGIGGGHLWANFANNDNEISFSTPTYVNSFKMNAKPWEGFTSTNEDIGKIDIIGLNTAGETVWSRIWTSEPEDNSVDLTNYTVWGDVDVDVDDNWLTVSVEKADIISFTFMATGLPPHDNSFWPSIDNMIINDQMPQVPVPAAIWLFISGLAGIFGTGLSRRLSR